MTSPTPKRSVLGKWFGWLVGKRAERDFFVEWLEGHGETNVVVDEQGVGISGNQTRLRSSVYGVKKHPHAYVVETEFRVRLPGGQEIIEFVAGMGESRDAAEADA